jgi:4-hydroxy-tetrahydrodipicolinate synthase
MSMGGKGVISVAANVAPKQISEMVEAMFLETNPIPVKKAVDMIGIAAGHVRLPLGELSKENEGKLRKVRDRLGAMIGKR